MMAPLGMSMALKRIPTNCAAVLPAASEPSSRSELPASRAPMVCVWPGLGMYYSRSSPGAFTCTSSVFWACAVAANTTHAKSVRKICFIGTKLVLVKISRCKISNTDMPHPKFVR